MRGVLFIGGSGPSPPVIQRILKRGDLVAAADSGLETALGAGVRPSFVVGDMDSLSDRGLLEGFPEHCVDVYSADKDETDTELGMRRLSREGCRSLILIGGGEGRLDHTLALKSLFDGSLPPDLWYTLREEIRLIEGEQTVTGLTDSALSYFPAGGGTWDVASSGLRWELDGLEWDKGAISLSNRLESGRATIHVRSGRLIQIRPIEDALSFQDVGRKQ